MESTTIRDRSNPFEEFDDEQFSARFRLPKSSMVHIIDLIEEQSLPSTYSLGFSVPTWLQVLIAMRFYGTGAQQILVGDYAGLHQTTVSRIVKKISTAIAKLRDRFIAFPSNSDKLNDVRRKFYQIALFPGVIGAIDCTHVQILCPPGPTAELFRNRKGFFSINVQVIGDAELVIRNIVARWPGSTHDARIFDNSSIGCQLSNTNEGGYLLGDSGYPCRTYLLTPFSNPKDSSERRFNFAHAKTQTTVERLFGVWKRRFPCVAAGLRTKLETSLAVIIATTMFHNFARHHNLPEPTEGSLELSSSEEALHTSSADLGTVHGFAVRRSIAQRFR